jgi:leader peptidase (prepilin peptidase)/N-methyltransferase
MSESQRTILLAASGALGLIIGSFLNVCIFRLPRNCMSLVRPRSRCPKCLSPIAWYDNVPVASWIVLGGKCRSCRARISPRYALVELLTGALFFYAGWRQLSVATAAGPERAVTFAFQAAVVSSMIVCTFIDLDFRILPDEITIAGTVVVVAASALFPFLHPALPPPRGILSDAHVGAAAGSLLGALTGAGVIYGVGVLGKVLFRRRIARLGQTEAMGFGDVKYMAMIGAVLGWRGVLLALVVACVGGALFGIGKLIVMRRMGYAPFGPFLSMGALAMLFWAPTVEAAVRAYMNWVNRLVGSVIGSR